MKKISTIGFGLIVALLATGPVLAESERLLMPSNAPASFASECAGCHIAYSPSLLPAESWNRIMNGLAQHFGTDASLTENQTREIRRWLTTNAAQSKKRSQPPPEDRITKSAWFTKEHREITQAIWARPAIKTPANCVACHPQAEKGNFDDDHIRIPK